VRSFWPCLPGSRFLSGVDLDRGGYRTDFMKGSVRLFNGQVSSPDRMADVWMSESEHADPVVDMR